MTEKTEREIVHRDLDPDAGDPAVQIIEAIMDVEGVNYTELPPIYDCVDGMLDELFSTPPAPEAQMEVEFSFHGYRITVEQNGNAKFVKTA